MREKITWIFLFIMIYWAYCIFWGVRGSIKARRAADYFVAGRQLPFWVFIFAVTATCFSGWTFIGHPGLTYSDGLQYAYASFYAITIPFTGVLFLKRQWIIGKHFGFVTPGEMYSYYFRSEAMRVLVVFVAIIFSVFYVGVQLRAAGLLFNAVTDDLIQVNFGMTMLALVMVSYVASGGLRTVAYSDILQFFLLAGGIVAIGAFTMYFVGGPERFAAAIAGLAEIDHIVTPDGHSHYVAIPGVIQFVSHGPSAEGGAWTGVMILTYMFALMGIQSSPAFTMWAFASKSAAPFAPQQVWASSLVIGLILIVFTVIQGMGGHFLGADHHFMFRHIELTNDVMVPALGALDLEFMPGKQDSLVPHLINTMDLIAPWLVGLLAVCALAAMESTASCYMATAGGILTRDFIGHYLIESPAQRTQKFIARLAIVTVVAFALLVAITSTDALAKLGGIAVSVGFQMWPALIAVCYWPFLTRQGVVLGLIAGLIAVVLTDSVGQDWLGIEAWGRWPLTIHSAAWGIAANLLVAIPVSWVTRDDRERKMQFHALVRYHASVPAQKRAWIPVAWLFTLLWFLFAVGPGAVIGNTIFGNPADQETWIFGIPSIWAWQIGGWVTGVAMMWFLAYFMELGTAPRTEVEALADDIDEAHVKDAAEGERGSAG